MSFLKDLKKQSEITFKQKTPKKESFKQTFKQDDFKVSPDVSSINDIPNTNIMTSGKLIGVHLRAGKEKMLKNLRSYINKLLGE